MDRFHREISFRRFMLFYAPADGDSVGDYVGDTVGDTVGDSVGESEGARCGKYRRVKKGCILLKNRTTQKNMERAIC